MYTVYPEYTDKVPYCPHAAKLIPNLQTKPDKTSKQKFIMAGSVNAYASFIEETRTHFQHNNRTKEYSGHSAKVHSVAWSCDGKMLASGSFDKTVCLYSLDRDRLVTTKKRSLLLAIYSLSPNFYFCHIVVTIYSILSEVEEPFIL